MNAALCKVVVRMMVDMHAQLNADSVLSSDESTCLYSDKTNLHYTMWTLLFSLYILELFALQV